MFCSQRQGHWFTTTNTICICFIGLTGNVRRKCSNSSFDKQAVFPFSSQFRGGQNHQKILPRLLTKNSEWRRFLSRNFSQRQREKPFKVSKLNMKFPVVGGNQLVIYKTWWRWKTNPASRGQGHVSRKSWELFGPEKPVVKLQSACLEKLIF